MCRLGGIVLIRRQGEWKVEEWMDGEAPEHDHFFLTFGYLDEKGYPVLSRFPDGSGILIGRRFTNPRHEWYNDMPHFFLDGIRLTGPEGEKEDA
jgi:hypothetical protein